MVELCIHLHELVLFSICILHKKDDNILDFVQMNFLQLVFMKHSLDSKPKEKNKVYSCTCARTGAPYRLPGMA